MVLKILFIGFPNENIECIYGDYKFLRNCGNNGFISKYWNKPPGTFVTGDMHKGITQLRASPFEKFRKHFCFEGGPLVGIKALLYNLSLRSDIEIKVTNEFPILDGNNDYDFYYIHIINDKIKQDILKNGNKLDNKLVLSLHLDSKIYNELNRIKYIKWSHNSNRPAKYYLSYPIHRTLYDTYPMRKINTSRSNNVMLYMKRNTQNRHLKSKINSVKPKIVKYFSDNGYTVHTFDYTSGGYRRSELMNTANECKLCLYLSYYDDGALVINEITMMGCFIIGHKDVVKGYSNHSIPDSCILDDTNGMYMNEFAHIFKPENYNDEYLEQCCNKVINLLDTKEFDHMDIAKQTRDYFTEDRFLETVFKK